MAETLVPPTSSIEVRDILLRSVRSEMFIEFLGSRSIKLLKERNVKTQHCAP